MINNYDEFPRRMQTLLLKKEQEYGPLKYLLFRTTTETSDHIDDLVQAVVDIVYELELIPKDTNEAEKSTIIDNQDVIQCYYYILLNTNFSSQELLMEDPEVGHLVGVCPALSLYVFIQIIWSLKCEEILCESLQHMPLDLCVEVLEIAVRCVTELESTRDVNLLFNLANTIYFTCLKLHLGTVSQKNVTECTNQLVSTFYTILDQISEFACSSESVKKRTKYKQHGHLLKRILRNTQLCMHWKTLISLEDSDKAQVKKLHKLTYGDLNNSQRYYHALSADEVKPIVTMLDLELVNLLLREMKRVDCNEYMEWADIYDTEYSAILLQRAVAIECYYFMEFMKGDEFLTQNEQLRQCLRQLIGSNSDTFCLSIDEICHGIDNGRHENMKELLKRYKDWNQSTLDFIAERTQLLKGHDYNILFEYLNHVFGCSYTENEKYQAYTSVLRIILQQDLPKMISTVTTYVMQHFDNNVLERLYNQEIFEKFIARNEFVHDAQSLRTLLIFTLLNAKAVVTTLVRIATGCYEHIIFAPRDILLLRPLFESYKIKYSKNGDQSNLLTSIMRTVCLENSNWSAKKFGKFIEVIVDSQLTHLDDLINDVFIPYLLKSSYEWSNLLFVTTYVHNVIKEQRYSSRTDYALLYKALIKRLSLIRQCNPSYSRGPVNNIKLLMRRTLHILLVMPDALTENERRQVMNEIDSSVEPIDRELNGHVMDVIQNYERRCLAVYRRLSTEPALRDYTKSFRLDREAFIRHMMLHGSTKEFEVFALQLTTVFWFAFGWADELDAFENVTRIAADAARLALTCDRVFPEDSLVTLLQAIVQYCSQLTNIGNIDLKVIRRVLIRTMFSLKTAVKNTSYCETYKSLLVRVKNIDVDQFDLNKQAYLEEIENWIDVFLVKCDNPIPDNPREGSNSDEESDESEKIRGMIDAYTFVCRCIAIPVAKNQISANWIADFIIQQQKERKENISCD
ncbi:uncharacterized protein LOC109854243 [Pseudomyrmex gracilis]|uniref:uncharacterized protein LOC109854243 n=1 Tax=Pseudomyrmex gracilis TaxID=219809 RepID=UPI0009952F51|nr:uncharacterized protein LOC109854243 [Pseudomyrmex gracilis]